MLKYKITIPVLYEVQKSLVSLAITLTDIYYEVNLMVILNRSANYAHMPIINIVKKYDWTGNIGYASNCQLSGLH